MSAHKDDIVRVHGEHPDWTAKQIADHLSIDRYHVYNTARAERLTLTTAVRAPALPEACVPAIVTPAPVAATDFTVYANNPADMAQAQGAMVAWCDAKIRAEEAELAEARRNFEGALETGWSSGWERQVKLLEQKIAFYMKVKMALDAGYYIVPPFPVELFAIRTKRVKPDKHTTTYAALHTQDAQMLPAGEGRYVSNLPEEYVRDLPGPVRDGKPTVTREYFGENFREVDFPFSLARFEIMQATQAAMALRVFDQMGSLPGSRRTPDPIICGQILMPHRNRQPLTFFVSWWLDTRTL